MSSIDIQFATKSLHPTIREIKKWIKAVFEEQKKSGQLVIRIVDEQEMTTLNHQFRKKENPTNVLSFRSQFPGKIKDPPLGDIVICAPVVILEAHIQKKPLASHWAHMVVHGVLHLLGYDHENELDAKIMENHEIQILNHLGFLDPYKVGETYEQ